MLSAEIGEMLVNVILSLSLVRINIENNIPEQINAIEKNRIDNPLVNLK